MSVIPAPEAAQPHYKNGHAHPNGVDRTEALLEAILARVEALDQRVQRYEALAAQAPAFIGMATDTVDGWVTQMNQQGINLDARARDLLRLLERLSAPEPLAALRTLVDLLPTASQLAQQAPGMVAMLVDTLDETVARMRQNGVDVEYLGRRGLSMAKALVDSHVLDEQPVAVISSAAQAIAESAQNPQPASLFSLLRAMSDPQVQRALGFLLAFARAFGAHLK